MKKNIMQLTALSVMAASVALTGCAAKRHSSEVVVSPMATGNGSGYYTGGPLVSNSSAVLAQAANAQAVVYFDFDSSNIGSNGQNVLNKHVAILKSDPNARVVITGNTDERGSSEYNLALGERRAKAVQAYLGSKGIPASRTEAVSNGEDNPADPGHNEAAWAKNRRAELAY